MQDAPTPPEASPPEPEGPRAAPAPWDAPPPRWQTSAWELVKTVTLVLVIVTTLRAFVVEAYVIHGKSMEPTFHDSERLLISKFAPRLESLVRGDIVIFDHPDEPGKRLIKRVIGLPGEAIEINDGRVWIDDGPLEEPYLEEIDRGAHYPRTVIEDDHYFVLGDNRGISNDSRRMGPIPRDAVIGKALVLFYPKIKVF